MNIPVFNVQTTNVYPAANSKAGGQLNTEYNIRSRETVGVGPSDAEHAIQYFCGPSFVHSQHDFDLQSYSNGSGIFRIAPGRALVNGHYIEVLDDDGIIVDLLSLINQLRQSGRTEEANKLKGRLGVGLKAVYNTTQTMMSSILVEETTGLFYGIQLVILPYNEIVLPTDSPTDESAVTAHILLGDLYFNSGAIVNQVDSTGEVTADSIHNNYPAKCVIMTADRLGNAAEMMDQTYVTRTGLDPNKLYIMAGKPDPTTHQITNESTWCDATSSLMVFDPSPKEVTNPSLISNRASFVAARYNDTTREWISDPKGSVYLRLPHKQADGQMHYDNNHPFWWGDKGIQIPSASFGEDTSGVVTGEYTKSIKNIEKKINNIYQLTGGSAKQLMYIDTLNSRDELPPIPSGAHEGDYILVGHDSTISYNIDAETIWMPAAPSSIYVVLPSVVDSVKFKKNINSSSTTDLTGVRLAKIETSMPDSSRYPYQIISVTYQGQPNYKVVQFSSATIANDFFNSVVNLQDSEYRGKLHEDYFVLSYNYIDEDDTIYPQEAYFTVESNSGGRIWSPPIQLQGEFSLATTETIGGFLNVDETAEYRDAGYVILDSNGHLRLLDYSILRSDGLSYQLGQDMNIGEGQDLESIQAMLDDYINDRIAFANAHHALLAASSSVTDADRTFLDRIVITLTLPEEEGVLRLQRIDSRFSTSILLKIRGKATSNTVLMISDCARLRIDGNIEGNPTIKLNNTCLFYDASVIDKIPIIDNLTLWYDNKYDIVYDSQGSIVATPPNLFINGNEVITLDPISDIQGIDFWSYSAAINDNHYSYAIRSITLDRTGTVIGASIFIRCDATGNISEGYFVSKQPFELPTSVALNYPSSKLTRQIKIDGCFVHAYSTQSSQGPAFIVIETKFTAASQYLASSYDTSTLSTVTSTEDGGLYLYQTVKQVNSIAGLDATDGAQLLSGGWHFFSGGCY